MDNTKLKSRTLNQAGLTVVELLVTIAIAGFVLVAFVTVSVYMYGDTIRNSLYANMASESTTILRSIVEELRQSSAIRATNSNPDPNAPGGTWTTSNSNLILIIAEPVLDSNNNFVVDPNTGYPYQNEIVYFASGTSLYKRYLANANAPGNTRKTTCPAGIASSSCPPDILMTTNFKTMNFVFYDQNAAVTSNLTTARSIQLHIQLQRTTYGETLPFDNSIRITIRNTAS